MKKLLFAILVFISACCFATHNRAGEIIYTRVAPFSEVVGGVEVQVYTYSITLIKYTDHDDDLTVVDRCSDTLYFGDSEKAVVDRINSTVGFTCNCGSGPCGEIIRNDQDYVVKKSIYRIRGSGVHRYSSTGKYWIRNFDRNRNANIVNIPNSIQQPFYVESYLEINTFTGPNTSPRFYYDPIDRACLGKCFTHNPGAYDSDGDSLSFELTECRGEGGNIIPGYTFPSPGLNGIFSISPTKGLLTWCSPQNIAEYNLAFIVKEWRKNTSKQYQMIGYVIRDMQVVVGPCNNDPPEIIVPQDTCVEAGTLIHKIIQVKDPNTGNVVTLQGQAGAFACPPPLAALTNTSGVMQPSNNNSFFANFTWQTTCDHVRQQGYETVFKAVDNATPPQELSTYNTYSIRVVPPTVKNVRAVPIGSGIKVNWALSTCSPAHNPLIGYRVYRKNDCVPFLPTPCQTGVSALSGFVLIKKASVTDSFYVDNDNGNGLVVGQNYSYLVIAVYADGSETFASSLVCARLKRDIPLLLNVDVLSTAPDTGSTWIRWTRPLTTTGNFDTLALPGPYKFIVKYRPAGTSDAYVPAYTTPVNSLFFKVDTQFTHKGLNTIASGYEYIIEFIAGSVSTGNSPLASSVFLTTRPSDRRIDLQWTSKTPWHNTKYNVWRKNPSSPVYKKIDQTFNNFYTDTTRKIFTGADTVFNTIINGQTYCYKIVSEGEYSDPTVYKPLLNTSQESCATAIDLTPPCAPTLTVEADCPTGFVKIFWTDVRNIRCGDDVVNYILYFKPTVNDTYQPVASGSFTYYVYDGLSLISGCYAVQAADANNNVSALSPDFCIDNCPVFELPNVFSPNNDGINDHFKAITDRVRQIREIDMSVFDRWGNLVYKTKDPYFNWDGISIFSKEPVSDGTLFYVCNVYESRLKGTVKRTLKGYVQVVR